MREVEKVEIILNKLQNFQLFELEHGALREQVKQTKYMIYATVHEEESIKIENYLSKINSFNILQAEKLEEEKQRIYNLYQCRLKYH